MPWVAMIGTGSMGGGIALLLAENGVEVSLEDPSEKAMDSIIDRAHKDGFADRIKKYKGGATDLTPSLP